MQRIGLLNGNNITYDKDNTAGLLASLTAGVISGFGITGSGAGASIQSGKALIECTRSNGEKIMLYFENTADFAVDLSGTKKVYILVDQAKIDDGSNNAENGTGIASIQTGANYPASNFIALYSIASGTPTDARISVKSKLARSGQTPYRLCIIDQDGNETFLAFGANGTALVSGGASVIPTWQAPSVSIVGLTEETQPDNYADFTIIYDASSGVNKKVKLNKIGKFGGTGADGALSITSGTTTIDLGGSSYVVKNYTSISITGTGKLAFTNANANGTVVVLKSQGDVVLTSSTVPCIDLVGFGGAVGQNGNWIMDTLQHYGNAGAGGGYSSSATTGGTAGVGLGNIAFYPLGPNKIYSKAIYLACGSGGNSGGNSGVYNYSGSGFGGAGGAGGKGGGALYIECNGSLNFTGTIDVSGAVGSAGATSSGSNGSCNAGAGGGGGGSYAGAGGAGGNGAYSGAGSAGAVGSAGAGSGGGGGGGGGGQGAGGGGGGSAGMCLILYSELTANTGTINAKGGAGGNGGGGSPGAGGVASASIGGIVIKNTEF